MSGSVINLNVEEDLKQKFAEVVKKKDTTVSQALRDYMRTVVEQANYNSWLNEKVQIARQDYLEGNCKSSDEVEALFAAKRANTAKKIAESKK